MQNLGFFALFLGMLGLGAAYLLYPLLSQKQRTNRPTNLNSPELTEVEQEREAAYAALYELDQDFATGQLNLGDYEELRSNAKQQAIVALLRLDQLKAQQTELETEIEAAIAKVHSRLQVKSNSKISDKGSKGQKGVERGRFCDECGQVARSTASFCSECGAKLAPVEV